MRSGSLKNLSSEDVARLELLTRVGKRINTPDNVNDTLQAILDSVVDSLEAERGALFLADPQRSPELILAVDRAADRGSEFSYSKTVVEKVWKELQPLAMVDAQGEEDFASAVSIQAQGIRSVMCVPLIGRQSALGLIYLDNRLSNAFTRSDLQMLGIIADFAATALERTRFFEALQKLNDGLETMVTERTREAEEARAEAERATQAKSLFLANMSHELRTPLNGVLGLTDDLLRDEIGPSLRLRLEQIGHSARSLSTLVNGILDFSKIESGRVELDNHPFHLESVLKTMLATVAYSAQQKGLELVVSLQSEVPSEVEGDSTRLKQILINLLANAVKFTETGWVKLTVESPSPGRLRFAVSDSGIGIAPEKQKVIFEPFSQADASTTRQFGGTGLGLSICHALTELLGGELKLESQPGQGSRFHFEVPLRPLAAYHPPSLGGVRLWVEDPELEHCRGLLALLASWGVELVSSPSQAQLGIVPPRREPDGMPCVYLVSNHEMALFHSSELAAQSISMLRPVLREELGEALTQLLSRRDSPSGVSPARRVDDAQPCPPEGAVLLVAEDHEINQLVTQRMAESWGYQCRFAISGSDVVRQFAVETPHLVLMDIEMPGVDGFAASRQIRRLEQAAGRTDWVPILAVTAHLAPDLRARCLESGMDDLLAKPLSRSLLAARLAMWEKVLKGELDRSAARWRGHKELREWPSRFLSEIHAALSTLSVLAERDDEQAKVATAGRLERLAFAAGLLSWGGQLVAWRTEGQPQDLLVILEQFRQDWKRLAPTLLHRDP